MQMNITWQQLSILGKSRIVKSTYIWMILIPIFAKILENVDPEVRLIIFDQIFHFSLTLPFSWKALYFSSLFFAFGAIIYQFRCPRIIKEYQTYREFADAKQSHQYLLKEATKIFGYAERTTKKDIIDLLCDYKELTGRDGNSDLTSFVNQQVRSQNIYYISYTKSRSETHPEENKDKRDFEYMMANIKLDEDSEQHAFWYVFNNANTRHFIARLTSSICYCIAFLLLLVVLGQNIYSVAIA